MKTRKIISAAAEETYQIGLQFGQNLKLPCIIAFLGDLGAGKTTFIRGLASSVGIDEREVCSPTFAYLNIYEGRTKIYHFDLYRIPTEREFIAAGFDEFLHADGICCIEWSEKITSLLPKNIYRVSITAVKEDLREIHIEEDSSIEQ
jgi:tRNA threonylcarbamoyladenosine biosynthesis protein TsaE